MKYVLIGIALFLAVQALALLLFYVSGEPFTRTPDHAVFLFFSLAVGCAAGAPAAAMADGLS